MLIPAIYFPYPDKILRVFVKDYRFLLTCLSYSGRLLATGFSLGLACGLTTGILVGWSNSWKYWINPLIKIIGPIPSTAWIPVALVTFASSMQASIFLIALAVWFPTTVLTSSGISNVKNAYFEVGSTLGAGTFQKIFKIALPDAMPSIFIGVFNGTCSSFLTLMTAEMLGVKFGIGWYINWQREVMAYANVYAGLITIAVTFSLIITAMFKVRDRVLGWQKGVIKW
jgi:NitT/TauT family transport system permease protein